RADVAADRRPRAGGGDRVSGDLDELLPAIGAGDANAFGRFVAGAEAPLRASLRSFATRIDVEAVLQETLLRLWQIAPRFTPAGRPNGSPRFAHRPCRHLAISELRRLRASVSDEDLIDRTASEPDPPPDPLLRRTIDICRDKLPRKPALALEARMSSQGAEPD